MQTASLCVTCPHSLGICGALLQNTSSELHLPRQADCRRFRMAHASEQVVTQNTTSEDVFVLCSGWAFRFFQLSDGRRQILNFLLPGDLFSIATVFSERFHFSVKALTEIQFRGFRRAEILSRRHPNADLSTALANVCVTATGTADEMLTVLGQRSAVERIAYLFLHLMRRIGDQGIVHEHRYRLPLRHRHIGDAVGLTSVHVSRVLSHFRSRNIAELSDGFLQVFDLEELQRLGSLS
ncbi:MAG: Crp/Fnr family transcriptional regulator [Xanthobacteraceae bacterium]